MAIDKHISGAVEKFEDTAGTSHIINAEYIGGYDAREVFPNYGEVKTANRLSNKGYTGSATWYYPLLKLPVDNAGNYASAIVTGRIGGWVASNMSFCQFLIWNRDGEGITCLHRDGKGSTSEATNTADLVVYRNSDNTSTVYIKCNSYFTYDLNVQTYQSSATIVYNGKYSATAPTGTLKVSGANATTRLELSKNGAVYNGGALALKSDLTNYQPKGNYVTTDTVQTISAKKTFSATPALSAIKSKKVLGTDANGLIEAHSLGISDISDLQTQLNGKQPSGDYVTYDNASKDIYLGSHGIYSGARPSSGGVTMAGNGYWIKEGSVGVSSAVTGGGAVSSEMTPNYVSVANGKIKLNSSGIVSDSGTFTFDGNPGSVATSADIKNLQTALNGKANASHTHSISQITNLQTSLDGKAPKSHSHTISDVTNLQSTLNGKANSSHTHAISDVTDLQTRLDGKMDTYTITKNPLSMNKDGFAQFGTDVTYQLTQYYQLSKAFGYVRALDKGGQVSNNNSYFTCFGDVNGGTYIGTAVYDRDYNSTTDSLYTSHGLLIDAYGSAFLLSGSKQSEKIKQIATTDDTKSLQDSIDGKQAKLVSGTNIKTINGNSILGSGNLSINASLPANSDVTLQTLSFHGGKNYSISGIYVLETNAVSLGGSVGSNASINFSIDRSYYSDFSSGRWYYVATPTSGGYIDTIAVGVEATTSGSGGGKIWIRRVSSGNTQNYKVTVYCIRQY